MALEFCCGGEWQVAFCKKLAAWDGRGCLAWWNLVKRILRDFLSFFNMQAWLRFSYFSSYITGAVIPGHEWWKYGICSRQLALPQRLGMRSMKAVWGYQDGQMDWWGQSEALILRASFINSLSLVWKWHLVDFENRKPQKSTKLCISKNMDLPCLLFLL